jgi:hypothetical protein
LDIRNVAIVDKDVKKIESFADRSASCAVGSPNPTVVYDFVWRLGSVRKILTFRVVASILVQNWDANGCSR